MGSAHARGKRFSYPLFHALSLSLQLFVLFCFFILFSKVLITSFSFFFSFTFDVQMLKSRSILTIKQLVNSDLTLSQLDVPFALSEQIRITLSSLQPISTIARNYDVRYKRSQFDTARTGALNPSISQAQLRHRMSSRTSLMSASREMAYVSREGNDSFFFVYV